MAFVTFGQKVAETIDQLSKENQELKAEVERLIKANSVLRVRLCDIAAGVAIQPQLHAAAGIKEADEILNAQ